MSDTPTPEFLREVLSKQMQAQNPNSIAPEAKELVDEIIEAHYPLDLIESCDLLERASAAGNLDVVKALCSYVDFFVYRSFALVLALRSGHSDVARWLIEHEGVDLLAPIQRPEQMSVMLPPDTTFTRSALTKSSTYLFLNPLDPTPSTYIFRPYTGFEQLMDRPYSCEFSMQKAAKSTHEIVEAGLVDDIVFIDLFRAYLVCAARKYRDRRSEKDMADGRICLTEAEFMLNLHRDMNGASGYGDERLYDILGSLIVPRCAPEIYEFIARIAPDVLLERLYELEWLQDEIDLIAPLVSILEPSDNSDHNAALLIMLAKNNCLEEIKILESWDRAFDDAAFEQALGCASDLEYVEMATYLLSRKTKQHKADTSDDANVEDDLLGLLLL